MFLFVCLFFFPSHGGHQDRRDGRLCMVVVGLNTARKTKDARSAGLNKDTPELEAPFGHLPHPSLVQLFLQAILSPTLPPTLKIWGFSAGLANSSVAPHPHESWI